MTLYTPKAKVLQLINTLRYPRINSSPKSNSNSLPLDGDNLLLATLVINPSSNPDHLFTPDKLLFCYTVILKTIDSYLSGKYSDFDGHTNSNCCHGMALLAQRLIISLNQIDLSSLREEAIQKLQEISELKTGSHPCKWWIPKSLANLACLYILHMVRETDFQKGSRTSVAKLKAIVPISTNTGEKITQGLQKLFSNWVGLSYSTYLSQIDKDTLISGAPVHMWGKYISTNYIRTDRRGVKYVSNLFSMQVALAHLIRTKAKVALINDIRDTSGNIVDRYVAIFKGDGKENFKHLSSEDIKNLSFFHQNEPIVILGGSVYSDELDKKAIALKIQPWLNNLSGLLLACDVFYPQFTKVSDDTDFNSSPITPPEPLLKTLINTYSKTKGISIQDPTLYCASHIFPASLKEVLQVLNGSDVHALPLSFLPRIKLSSPTV